ncbi:MAG TPA: NAD(P)/FAD-dependent oxidoreductase [Desulfomonilia bacterium]
MKVIIIGAGAAGLAASYILKKNGIGSLCLEENSFAGGRTASRNRDGYILDTGAQFLFRYYHTYFMLSRELGLSAELVQMPFRAGIPPAIGRKPSPVLASIRPLDIIKNLPELLRFRGVPMKAIFELIKITPDIIKRIGKLDFTNYEPSLDLDTISLADFTLRKAGSSLLEHVFQPVASCMTLGEPEDVAANYGLALLLYCINGLWTFRNGMGSLSARLYDECKGSVKLNTKVNRIVIEGKSVKGVETNEGLIECKNVICTATATSVMKLIPDLPDTIIKPLETVRYSQSCHVIFGLEKRLLPEGWYAVALPRKFGSAMAGYTESSMKSPFYAPHGAGLINCFTYGRQAAELIKMKDDDIKKYLIKDIQRFTPDMPDFPVFTEILRFSEAVCTSPPGMLTAISRMKKDGLGDVKGLFLAGEYMYMPSVEGAAKSGIDAANAIIRSMGA